VHATLGPTLGSIVDPLLRLAAMLAVLHAILLAPIDPEYAAWAPGHGHIQLGHGTAPGHTHPWDDEHGTPASGEADVVFLTSVDGVAAAARPAIAGDVFRLASLAIEERALVIPARAAPGSPPSDVPDPPPRATSIA
jgi:hypothetical protein